jgi:outer membrane immunogenic protein
MRKWLLSLAFVAVGSSAAFAKPIVYNWNGFYIGAHAGGAWGDVNVTDDVNDGVPPGPFGYSIDAFIGGGTAGYNLQIDNVVLGVEGDLGVIDPNGSGIIPSSTPPNHQDTTLDSGLYGDVTGRLGLAFGPALIYAKGGWAFFDGEAKQTTTKPGFVTHGTDTFEGWTLGGGVEYLLAKNVSVKVEYQHFDFRPEVGDQTSITDPPVGHVYHNWTDLTIDSVNAGVAYHF